MIVWDLLLKLPGLAGGLLAWLNKKTDADLEKFKAGVASDTAISVEDIRARVELTRLAAAQRAADREHWSTAWMVPAAFGVFLTHAAAIVFDSMPLFGHAVGSWKIAALPGEYAGMQTAVILTVCGVGGASAVKRIFWR